MSFVNRGRSDGFSLVEVLLVIVIILMLAGALVVYVLPQQEGAQRNTTRLKLMGIESALNLYKASLGSYPNEEQGGLNALLVRPEYEDPRLAERWTGPYLNRGTRLDDSWGNLLAYELVDKTLTDDPTAPDFRLLSVGPDGQPDTEDDVPLFLVDPLDPAAPLDAATTPANAPVTE